MRQQIQLEGRFATVLAFLIYFLLLILLTFGETNLGLVFLGTLPIFLDIVIISAVINRHPINVITYWVVPAIFPLAFFILWTSQGYASLSGMDGPVLVAIQFVTIYLIHALLYALCEKKHIDAKKEAKIVQQEEQQAQDYYQAYQHAAYEKQHYQNLAQQYQQQAQQQLQQLQQLEDDVSQRYEQLIDEYKAENEDYKHKIDTLESQVKQGKEDVTEESLNIHLHNVEEKAKSLNAIIGRVYQDKNGGSAKIRERLHIPREFYNALTHDASLPALEGIYEKLLILELPEKGVFHIRKKVLRRDENGNDPIIEVLANNDSDPAMTIYTELKDLCQKIIHYVREK